VRALPMLLMLFLSACMVQPGPRRPPGEITSHQDRFMSREESAREVKSTRHSDFWGKVIAEREKRAAAELAAKKEPPQTTRARTIVAVFDLEGEGSGFDAPTLEALSDYLATRVALSGSYGLVPRSDLRQLIVQQKAESYRECYDEACRIELGRALAAQKSLSPRLIRAGETCVVGIVLYDLSQEIAERATTVRERCAEESILDAIDRAVQDIEVR
jgi:hypothetical protein